MEGTTCSILIGNKTSSILPKPKTVWTVCCLVGDCGAFELQRLSKVVKILYFSRGHPFVRNVGNDKLFPMLGYCVNYETPNHICCLLPFSYLLWFLEDSQSQRASSVSMYSGWSTPETRQSNLPEALLPRSLFSPV